MLHVSQNELVATIQRALKARGVNVGQRNEAAEAAVLMERHGLGGADAIVGALRHCSEDSLHTLEEHYREDGLRIFTAAGASVIHVGSLIIDILRSMMGEGDPVCLHVKECRNGDLMSGYLLRMAGLCPNMVVRWLAENDTGYRFACLEERQRIRLCCVPCPTAERGKKDAAVLYGSRSILFSLENLAARVPEDDCREVVWENFRFEDRLSYTGFDLSEACWSQLRETAKGVLVEHEMA